jgi:hypothetical protein
MTGMPALAEPPHHVTAHLAKPDKSQFHPRPLPCKFKRLFWTRFDRSGSELWRKMGSPLLVGR